MAYSLVTYPDDRLKVDHSAPIKFVENRSSIDILFPIMKKAMTQLNGLGISAVQIGAHLPICIVGDLYMINPKILSMSIETEDMLEGCLSCPGERIKITRPKNVHVEYINTNGKKVRNQLEGLYARCFLHEFDHIRGKLIKD